MQIDNKQDKEIKYTCRVLKETKQERRWDMQRTEGVQECSFQ